MERKAALTAIRETLSQLEPVVASFCAKADAGEADPNKRLYGASTVANVRTLRKKLDSLADAIASDAEKIDAEFAAYEAEQEKINSEKLATLAEAARVEENRLAEERRVELEEAERRKKEAMEKEARSLAEKASELAKTKAAAAMVEKAKKEAEAAAEEARKQKEKEAKEALERAAAAAKAEADLKASKAPPPSLNISLTVKTTRGKSLSLTNVPPDCQVAHLKTLIANAHAVPVPNQRLIFQGRLLSDAKPIAEYRIVDGSAVHLVENGRAAATASVKSAASLNKPTVPPGTVCHLINGKAQFQEIAKNCGQHRMIVVDWSAKWCGPCQMIAPVYERLAARFSDVTFLSVDTEASPANSQFAAFKGISAYPTFHYYINGNCVHQFSGARASEIEAGINTYRKMVVLPSTTGGSSSGSSVASEGPFPAGSLTKNLFQALTTLKNNCPASEFIVAVRTLLTFVRNVVDNPGEEKYQKVRSGNSVFQSRLGTKAGGMDCMRAFGFRETEINGDTFLVLSAGHAMNPEFATVKTQLEQALAAAGGSSSAPAPAARSVPSSSTRSVPSTTAVPNEGLGVDNNVPNLRNILGDSAGTGSVNYEAAIRSVRDNPELMNIAAELITDPSAFSALMEAQAAFQSGDTASIERIQSNPALYRISRALMSNPMFLEALMGGAGEGMAGMAGRQGMQTPGTGVGQGGADTNATPGQNGGQTRAPAQPPLAGAPTTTEEEERLFQEAIRLSMQENNGADSTDQQAKKDSDSSK